MYKLESRVTSHESRVDGFTLIEILISIAIVGIVFGVIITSSQAIAKSSRDSQRQSDLRNIQSALQQYYADQNFFPENSFILSTAGSLTSSKGNSTSPLPSPAKIYLNTLPKDPTSGTYPPYCYTAFTASDMANSTCSNANGSTTQCHFYRIFAKLENPPSGGTTYSCPSQSTYNTYLSPN